MLRVIEDLAGDWRRLDERIEGLSNEIEVLARQDAGCERLMSVPGIGPIISSAIVAAIGLGCTYQAKELGSARAQAVVRSGQEAATSQRPRCRARQ